MKYAVLMSAALLTLATVSHADDPATLPSTLPATLPATAPVVEATTMPATAPATQASSASLNTPPMVRGKILPGGYAILNTRSIFMKGKVPPPIIPGVTTTTQPVTTSTVRPEHKIVFVGVTETDGSASAMFEDTAAGKIITAKLNDPIASGKVTEITLDTITYTADGKPVKVMVGQALDATDPPPVSARATITDNGNGPPTTGPVAAPGGGDSGATDPALADVIERMRARRRAGQ